MAAKQTAVLYAQSIFLSSFFFFVRRQIQAFVFKSEWLVSS